MPNDKGNYSKRKVSPEDKLNPYPPMSDMQKLGFVLAIGFGFGAAYYIYNRPKRRYEYEEDYFNYQRKRRELYEGQGIGREVFEEEIEPERDRKLLKANDFNR